MWMLSLLAFVASALLTYGVREFARKKELLDHPNERSSHTTPTPHGGGIAIVTVSYAGMAYLYVNAQLDGSLFAALLCSVPLVIISLLDDLYALSVRLRMSAHLVCAAGALYFLGGVDTLELGLFTLHSSWLNLIALLAIVWMLNLYNFLDGIDGYAGSEALFIGTAAYLLLGSDVALLIAMAAAGFLLFNWQKASIFMGDVGSIFLGFVFAVLAFADASAPTFLVWVLLPVLFWFDATLTLIRRYRRGEAITQPHKEHAYQRLVQSGFSHQKSVIFALIANLMLLFALLLANPEHYFYILLGTLAIVYGLIKWIDKRKTNP